MLLRRSLESARALRSEGAANVAMCDSAPKIGATWVKPAPVRQPARPVQSRGILSRIILGAN